MLFVRPTIGHGGSYRVKASLLIIRVIKLKSSLDNI